MAYEFEKKTGEIIIKGWENGIAPSPYDGIADLKNINITSIKGEASISYNRTRLDQPSTSGTFTSTGSHIFSYAGNLTPGTWVQITGHTGTTGLTTGNYYYVAVVSQGATFKLYSDFGVTQITGDSGAGTATFTTLAMGTPMSWTAVQVGSAGSSLLYAYFILDANGIVWVNGNATLTAVTGPLTPATTWAAITPYGSSTNAFQSGGITARGSLCTFYATDTTTKKITGRYLAVLTDTNMYFITGAQGSTWPSLNTGSLPASFYSFNSTAAPHIAQLGVDQVMYFTDGCTLGTLTQAVGKTFNPTDSTTYSLTTAFYISDAQDTLQQIAFLPGNGGISVVAAGILNRLYFFPSYGSAVATGGFATTILWMPESNTFNLLAVNNYVVIFCGSKGNIYLTNGSSVVPIATVPDYIAGSANFVQDPYFVWGGAMYLRGRIFFSIQDQTSAHLTANCGGVWSFVPSLSYFVNQDTGLSLRLESASSLYSTFGYNGYAPVIFSGLENNSQQVDGPQYVACWNQSNDLATFTNSVDFSGTNPQTNSSPLIETDAIPVGTFLERKTFRQIEVKVSAALAAGETITINYRTSLEAAWASAGTVIYDADRLAAITNEVTFEKVQIIQLQVILNGTSSSPSWIRIKEVYVR